VSVLDVAL